MTSPNTDDTEEPRHPIQVVARRTGLTPDVIRAWERRYGAVTPRRSDTRRRLYSDSETERLRLLKQATDLGRRIGDVATLGADELARLVESDRAAEVRSDGEGQAWSQRSGERGHLRACMGAVRALDPAALEHALASAAADLSVPVLLQDVVSPLMTGIGSEWRVGNLRVAHEHMASAGVRSFLGGVLASSNPSTTGPVLIVATPLGQVHELGALMAAVAAAAVGWQPLYLGAAIPTDEIVYATRSRRARAVALSICYPGDDGAVDPELRKLRSRLPAETVLLVGGRARSSYGRFVAESDAVAVNDLAGLQRTLDELRSP